MKKSALVKEKMVKIIEEFNRYKAPEAMTRSTSFDEGSFKIEFIGTCCYTCGFYDYFDDFRILLEETGLKIRLLK